MDQILFVVPLSDKVGIVHIKMLANELAENLCEFEIYNPYRAADQETITTEKYQLVIDFTPLIPEKLAELRPKYQLPDDQRAIVVLNEQPEYFQSTDRIKKIILPSKQPIWKQVIALASLVRVLLNGA